MPSPQSACPPVRRPPCRSYGCTVALVVERTADRTMARTLALACLCSLLAAQMVSSGRREAASDCLHTAMLTAASPPLLRRRWPRCPQPRLTRPSSLRTSPVRDQGGLGMRGLRQGRTTGQPCLKLRIGAAACCCTQSAQRRTRNGTPRCSMVRARRQCARIVATSANRLCRPRIDTDFAPLL